MKVVKEVKTTTGKLSRGEETLGHVLVGKGSEVLPFHLNEVDIVPRRLLVTHLDQGEPGEGDIVLSLLHGYQHLVVSLAEVGSFLSQDQFLLSTNQDRLLIETLACLD